jgi:hypothetical protein
METVIHSVVEMNLVEFWILPHGKLMMFQAVFSLYDKDGSGCLSAFELRQALNSAGYRLNNHILNILAHRYSTKNGVITFDDYMMCAVRLKAMIGELSLLYSVETVYNICARSFYVLNCRLAVQIFSFCLFVSPYGFYGEQGGTVTFSGLSSIVCHGSHKSIPTLA